MTSEQRPEEGEGATWISGRRSSQAGEPARCKGPGAGMCLVCSSTSEEASEGKAETLAFSTLGSFSDTLGFLGRGREGVQMALGTPCELPTIAW